MSAVEWPWSRCHGMRPDNRSTPSVIAARLHFLAFVLGDIAGAYNDIGVRCWFDRPRKRLDGNKPAQSLGDEWSPGDDGPRRVQQNFIRYSPLVAESPTVKSSNPSSKSKCRSGKCTKSSLS